MRQHAGRRAHRASSGRAKTQPGRCRPAPPTATPIAIACTAADRRAVGVAFADAARDGCGRADAEADGDRVDDRQHRLGQPDGGDRVGAEARHEEHVDDGEDRLEHQLEHHRDCEEQNRAADRARRCTAAMRAGQRLANRRPELLLDSPTASAAREFTKKRRGERVDAAVVTVCTRSRRFPRAARRAAASRPARSCAQDDDRRTCVRRPRSSS